MDHDMPIMVFYLIIFYFIKYYIFYKIKNLRMDLNRLKK